MPDIGDHISLARFGRVFNALRVGDNFSSSGAATWLVPKGEMGRAVADFPWQTTPLGRLAAWPRALQSIVNMALGAGAPMGLVLGADFRFIYNDRYIPLIPGKHPAALGAGCDEIFSEIWDRLEPLFRRAYSGEAVVIEDYELQVNRDGATQQSFFSFSYNPIGDERGNVLGFLAVVVETTARVVQEQARAKVFDTVLSAITDFAYTIDRNGRFLYANHALLNLWGLELKDAVGKNFFELRYPDDLAHRLQAQVERVVREKISIRDETHYVSPAGVEGFYEYILSPVLAADGTVGLVAGSTRDVTSRKKLEIAALASARAKDDFLARLSHELRTPLNPVLLLATEAAGNAQLAPEVRADFQTIAENVSMEASLIDDLLDLSRITFDKLSLHLEIVDLHALLRRVAASIEPERRGKNLQLSLRLEARNFCVKGDPVRIQQVFTNLLRNAVKFTPEGGAIGISTITAAAEIRPLIIEVRDSGIGLSAEETATIFSPFVQGDHTQDRTNQFGGLGLGLAIARKLVEMHLGVISVESGGRNLGAKFRVQFPVSEKEIAPQDVLGGRPAEAASPISGMRVLLVEDHGASRRALKRLLARRNVDVTEAGSAAEALQHASSFPFDLAISDIGLPDMNGFELMAKLKSRHALPGIALTGYGTDEDIAKSKAAGFMSHLTKPVQSSALDQALANFAQTR